MSQRVNFSIISSFIRCILIASSPSPHFSQTFPSTSPLPEIHSSSVTLQKRTGFPGISTKHDITSYNKTGHKFSYQNWMRQPCRRKSISRAGERGGDNFPSHCESCHKKTQINNDNRYAEDLAQTHAGSTISKLLM